MNTAAGRPSMIVSGYVALKHIARHSEGELVLAQKNFAGVFFFEKHRFLLAVRAHHRLDPRIDRAREFDHAAHIQRIRCGDHQHACAVDMCLNQNRWFGGVAGNGGHTTLAQFLDDLTIFLGDDKGYAVGSQCFTDAAADSAVAHQHHLAGKPIQVDGHRQNRKGIGRSLQGLGKFRASSNPDLCRVDGAEDQWIQCDRNDCSCQNEALTFRWKKSQGNPQAGQDERKLADLGQAGGYRERRIQWVAKEKDEKKAASDLPKTIIAKTSNSFSGWLIMTFGSNNIPTDTKKRTEKASLNGKDSSAAR